MPSPPLTAGVARPWPRSVQPGRVCIDQQPSWTWLHSQECIKILRRPTCMPRAYEGAAAGVPESGGGTSIHLPAINRRPGHEGGTPHLHQHLD